MSDPVRISLQRSTWVALGLFAFLMLGLLAVQVALIEDQRSTVDRQLRTAVQQAEAARPLLEDAQPLVEELRGGAPAIKELGEDTGELVRELDRAEVGTALEAVRRLSVQLLRGELPQTLTRTADALTDVPRVTDELLAQDRLRRLLVRSTSVLGEVQQLNAVAKGARAAELAPQVARSLRRSLRLQETLLATQVDALSVVKDVREIARRTEGHAASLDRKLGGATLAPTRNR